MSKTKELDTDIHQFLSTFVESDSKRQESYQLIELMKNWSGFEPKMWGPSIIGFGSYHYKYESGHEGDSMLIGFSPRKSAFSLYTYVPTPQNEEALSKLGKFKMGKACIYFNKLSDINLNVLETMCHSTISFHLKNT
ncbi:DUF1801 domain-containing protein [Belliella sp. DSM 111904]|uniref:DUF1801 domain-containing protein n=1 Tax=Belliella filtrata TaxID=2923435 RepID=A0ABS9V050_9BACT|nr:DUF1801 domain-containing protein [Belliella filtrata]MCH7409786.1 DUF1801 domain-containing protein [Belliella filtrata]